MVVCCDAACAREEVAPLALDAYPEAYLEFKKLMLLLLAPPATAPAPSPLPCTSSPPPPPASSSQGGAGGGSDAKGDVTSGSQAPAPAQVELSAEVQQLWSSEAREELAGVVYHTARHHLGGWAGGGQGDVAQPCSACHSSSADAVASVTTPTCYTGIQ